MVEGPRCFSGLGREIGCCNPSTLTQRLTMLETLQLVHKNVQSRMPPRCTYELSQAGRALEQVIRAIDSWARDHMAQYQEPGTQAEVRAARGTDTQAPK